MTDIDAFRDDDGDENATAEKEPTLFYGSADEFVRERLWYMYARRVGPGNASFRWAARGGTTLKPSPVLMLCGAPGSICAWTGRQVQAPGGLSTPTTTCPS